MAIGRTFKAAWQKGLRGLEIGRPGWATGDSPEDDGLESLEKDHVLGALRRPRAERPFQIKRALEIGCTVEEIHAARPTSTLGFWINSRSSTNWSSWYEGLDQVSPADLRLMKRNGILGSSARSAPRGD